MLPACICTFVFLIRRPWAKRYKKKKTLGMCVCLFECVDHRDSQVGQPCVKFWRLHRDYSKWRKPRVSSPCREFKLGFSAVKDFLQQVWGFAKSWIEVKNNEQYRQNLYANNRAQWNSDFSHGSIEEKNILVTKIWLPTSQPGQLFSSTIISYFWWNHQLRNDEGQCITAVCRGPLSLEQNTNYCW